MCGITGIYSQCQITENDVDIVRRMNDVQKHRGPDEEGLQRSDCCVLGHRRLSIIDLSDAGHQPMADSSGRYWITFNGEIYNYIELRHKLEQLGFTFNSSTDTEVLLKMYIRYGVDSLSELNGMFAFAIHDMQENHIFFARDRFGIKPLYYTIVESKLIFASEIKSLRSIPSLKLSVNYQALFDYLIFNRTDVYDETFLNEIKRVPKGHHGTFEDGSIRITRWWNPEDYTCSCKQPSNFEDIVAEIDRILVSSVQFRMQSDVPVGSCLSGGLDSSILTGILYCNDLAEEGFKTFTASFPGHQIDETSYIDLLNKKYPFMNYRTLPDAEGAMENLNDFVYANDEPTTNPSFYSQYEVMRLARNEGVTVLLDGQGGDESFAGYQYFHGFYLTGLWQKGRYLKLLHELINVIIRRQDKTAWQTFIFQILPDYIRILILSKSLSYIKPQFFNDYINSSIIFNNFFDAQDLNTSLIRHFQYKLEHLLRIEDRNSMMFSVEARVPYLDHRLVQYVLSVNENLKIMSGQTKYLQKQAVGNYSINEILNRKDKIGFGTPGEEWMNTQRWVDRTNASVEYLRTCLPDVFSGDLSDQLPTTGNHRWKINQLAIWHQQVFS